jgi:tetratricopeptide (TPR) repeat protein
MVVELKGLRVFIATPGGLDEVRRRFFDRLVRFNHEDAHERGVAFLPVGWELNLAGKGRPQAQINDEVRRCDYMVLVLSDRWGTPPANDGPYTSGTEEEYNVARECIEDPVSPMRNIAVMFQGVDAARLTDPGEQLKKVLAFKDRLEKERWLLFTTFDSAQEFEDDLLAHLLRWTRDEEKGNDGALTVPPPSEPPDGTDDEREIHAPKRGDQGTDAEWSLLDEAKRLTKEGRLTRAESLYARAVAGPPDVEALTQYTRFLRRTGRLERATALSERLIEVAREHGDPGAEIEGLSNRGIIRRKRGDYSGSTSDFEAAIGIARGMGDAGLSNMAFLLDNVALTLRKEGRFAAALAALEQSLQIRNGIDDPRGLANSLNNVGALRRQRGDLDSAGDMHRRAINLFRELDDPRGEAQARANLGEVLYALGDFSAARSEFTESLEINEALKSPEGIGMNCWQLGRLALDLGDTDAARGYALRCLSIDEHGADRPESVGGAFHLFGQIELAVDDPQQAILSLERALAIYERTGQRLGASWTAADLARAHSGLGDEVAARRALAKAVELGAELDHVQLQEALRTARSVVEVSGS